MRDFILKQFHQKPSAIHITTTADPGIKTNVRDQFRDIQQRFPKDKIQFDIKDAAAELPPCRLINIKSQKCEYSLWLDKGVHIFWFEDMKKFQTLDTYIVIEKNLNDRDSRQISKR
jgi:hypothetical protein